MSYEKALEENARLGAVLVGKYLRGEIKGDDKIKIGSQAISQLNRHQATRGNIDAIRFAVGRAISVNQSELKLLFKKSAGLYAG
jgi:hypothetical protein